MSNEPSETVSTAPKGAKKDKGERVAAQSPNRRTSRSPRKKLEDKPAIAELQHAVTLAMNRDPLSRLPHFPRDFFTIEVEDGMPHIIEAREGGECFVSSRESVAQVILRYVTDDVIDSAYKWTAKQAYECAAFWHTYTQPIDPPKPLRWADEPGLCFHRLPWERAPTGAPTPLCDEIMSRMSNATAFRVWLGSIFDPRADLQQYVWLYGEGENGKGTLLRMLERVLGPAFTSQEPPTKDNRFWTYGLRNKRLAAFPDCNNAGFVASGLFKSLTGGDAVRIEGKGKDSTTARLSLKFLFLSNEKPRLSSEHADLRRVIFCELGPITGGAREGYEEELWQEFGEFMKGCIALYEDKCPRGGGIKCVEKEGIEDVVSVEEERFEVAYTQSFQAVGIDENRPDYEQAWVSPQEFQQVLDRWFREERKQSEFRKWLKRHHGIEKKRVRVPVTGLENRYLGIEMVKGWTP
jgi:hypothetical protein